MSPAGSTVKRRFWSAAEIAYVRREYRNGDTDVIAKHLGRSRTAVHGAAHKLGICKAPGFQSKLAREKNLAEAGRKHRFQPGHVPANKGLRRPGYAPGRMAETQFKKGQPSRNTLPVGTLRTCTKDGYIRIKVSDDPEPPGAKGGCRPNWKLLHYKVWEEINGPVPDGHRLWFRDRDPGNCAIENLELVTAREAMSRTTIHNLPPELKETIQLKGRLKRAIKRKAKTDGEKSSTGSQRPSVRDDRGTQGRGRAARCQPSARCR